MRVCQKDSLHQKIHLELPALYPSVSHTELLCNLMQYKLSTIIIYLFIASVIIGTDRKLEADHWHREDSFDFLSKQVKPTQSQESVDDLFITDSSIATELTLDASTEQLSNRHDKIESNGHRDTIESNCLSSFETTVF